MITKENNLLSLRIKYNIEGIDITESEGLSEENIKNTANETEQKATKMMLTYLGNNPDLSEALEFLSIAEGGEVFHYEGLDSLAQEFKDKGLAKKTKSILTEEKNHLDQCIQLVKQNISI